MKKKITVSTSKESFFNSKTENSSLSQMLEYVTLSSYDDARKLAGKNPLLMFHKIDENSASPLQLAFIHYDTRMWKIFLSVSEQEKTPDYQKIFIEQYDEIKGFINLDKLFESYNIQEVNLENDESYMALAKNQKLLPAWMKLLFCHKASNFWGIDIPDTLLQDADPVNFLVANQFTNDEEYLLTDVDFYSSIGVKNILVSVLTQSDGQFYTIIDGYNAA